MNPPARRWYALGWWFVLPLVALYLLMAQLAPAGVPLALERTVSRPRRQAPKRQAGDLGARRLGRRDPCCTATDRSARHAVSAACFVLTHMTPTGERWEPVL